MLLHLSKNINIGSQHLLREELDFMFPIEQLAVNRKYAAAEIGTYYKANVFEIDLT
jgi:hypothetical protein